MTTSTSDPAQPRQFSLWARLPLARKLQLAFAALFVFTIIIAAVALIGLGRVQAQYNQTLEEGVEVRRVSQELDIELLRARRAEKNFQLRWKSEGYDTAYNNYIPLFEAALKAMRADINNLETHASAAAALSASDDLTEASFKADLIQLEQYLDVYEEGFTSLVGADSRRGFSETTGFEGEFRTAASIIEAEISGKPGMEAMEITYLKLRRNDKDYLGRGDQEYIDNVRALVSELKAQISSSQSLTSAQRADLLRQADLYLTAFDGLVRIDQEIAVHETELVEAARAVEPLTIKILDIGVQLGAETTITAENTAQQVINASLAIGFIALVLAVALAIIIAQQLTRPVLALTSTAQEIAGGNFNAKAEVTSADEIGSLAQTFNAMTDRLGQAFEDVRRRSLAVQTSAEVSRRLSTATNARQLAVDVVEQVQAAFKYYHAHIYFVDKATGDLVMAGGTGEAGATMLARGHKISRGRGLVGRAAETNAPVLVPDVSVAEGWLPNPLLPATKAETAIPISAGKEVLGVLDVQHNIVNGLGEEDVELLQSLAGQVSISLQNARTFEESRVKAELEAMVNAIGQRIQRAGTVEETLQTAIREIGSALGAARVSANIQLQDTEPVKR